MDGGEFAARLTHSTPTYITNAPVDEPGTFFGREDLLEKLQFSLQDSRLVLLEGPRKIGKTSLLLRASHVFLATHLPVYFDLGSRAAQPLPQLVRELTDAILEAAGVNPPARRRLEDVTQANRMLLRALTGNGTGRRVLLLFDELGSAPATLQPDAVALRLMPYLQELIGLEQGPSIVLTRGRDRHGKPLSHNATILQQAPHFHLGPLDLESARRLLTEPTAGLLRFTEHALRKAIELTAGHPWLLQLCGQALLQHGQQLSAEHLGAAHLTHLTDQILRLGEAGFAWMWEGLSRPEQLVLTALAHSGPLDRAMTPREIQALIQTQLQPSDNVPEILKGLEQQELAVHDSSGRYQCAAGLWRRWLIQHQPLSQGRPGAQFPLESQTLLGNDPSLVSMSRVRHPGDTIEALWSAADALLSPADLSNQSLHGVLGGAASADTVEALSGLSAALQAAAQAASRRQTQGMALMPPPLRQEVRDDTLTGQSVKVRFDSDALSPGERWLVRGREAYTQGDIKSALFALRQAQAFEPTRLQATLQLAQVYSDNQQFVMSIETLRGITTLAPELSRDAMSRVYLRWMEEVHHDEETWTQVVEEAVRQLPGHEELRRRQREARVLRVKRLLNANRPLEAAAALGGLGTELQETLQVVMGPLLDTLENLTRRLQPDAEPLFSILRRLLPDPTLAWQRYLGPLVDEAERLERQKPDEAEDLYRRAESAITGAGSSAGAVPEGLRERLVAGRRRLTLLRHRDDDAMLKSLLKSSELDRAESWLEDLLIKRRSPHLEEKLRQVRTLRQLTQRYHTAGEAQKQQRFADAQRLLAQVVAELPDFVGPDGRSAAQSLDEVTSLKLGHDRALLRSRRMLLVGSVVAALGGLGLGRLLFG